MVIAYGVTVGSALALDRRFVSARLDEVSTSTGGGHSGHVVGDEIEVVVEFANHSTLPIFNLSADPYAPDQLALDGELDVPLLGRRRRVGCRATVTASGSGRWMLQGFDVTLGDPFGLVRVSDYIPCNFAFEFYPRVGRLDRTQKSRRLLRRPEEREGRRQRAEMTTGTVIRELRDYQSGDPLRHVAWKATARKRKLISRDFEDEITAGTTILLDISGSMRGGAWKGQKLEHAVELAAGIADELITSRNRVGMISFDEKVYGYIPPGSSQSHYHRILHHLLGLNSIVDPDLTELDDGELKELLVDYLLVQERLDFRSGGERQVKDELLDRWIRSRLDQERRRYHSPVLREGIVGSELSAVREFVQLRGLPVPYRVESRLGPKGRGMAQALERLVHDAPAPQFVVVISDLCGVSNFDVLDRGLALARHEGHKIRFLVPFTPSYHQEPEESSEKHDILLELFTASEREERMRGVEFLKEKGVDVQFIGQQARREGARGGG
jgi:uncharacterized protein (DUF58 family)